MNKKNEGHSSSEEEFDKLAEQAKEKFGDFLDFLDQIPGPKNDTKIPFPYGSSDVKPYGWYSN